MAAAKSGLENIMDLIGLISPKGGSTTTGTNTQTESNNVSPEAVQALINSILGGTQGLAAVSQGQRGAGLYNSSTNQQLTNDLLARTAAEASKLNSTKTVTNQINQTTTPTAQVSPGMAGAGLLGLGAAQLLAPTIKAGAKKFGLDDIGGSISNALFGGGGSSSSFVAPAMTDFSFGGGGTNDITSFLGGGGSSFSDSTSFFDDAFGIGDIVGNAISGIGSGLGDFFGGLFADGGRVPVRGYADGGLVQGFARNSDKGVAARLAAGERPERLGVMNYRPQVAPATQGNTGSVRQQQQIQEENAQLAKVLKQVGNLASDLLTPRDSISLLKARTPFSSEEGYLGSGDAGNGNFADFEDLILGASTKGAGTGVQAIDPKTAAANNFDRSGLDALRSQLQNIINQSRAPSDAKSAAAQALRDQYISIGNQYNAAVAQAPEDMRASFGTVDSSLAAWSNRYNNPLSIPGYSNPEYAPGGGTTGLPGASGGGTGGGGITIPIGGGSSGGSTGGGSGEFSSIGRANGGSIPTPTGKVPGHDTSGSDNVVTRLTGGEYILPVAVTDLIGKDALDAMVTAITGVRPN